MVHVETHIVAGLGEMSGHCVQHRHHAIDFVAPDDTGLGLWNKVRATAGWRRR